METTSSTSSDRPASPRRILWAPVVVVVLAALSIALLLVTYRASDAQAVQSGEIEDAIRQLAIAAASAHLWLEEYLTGDPTIDIDEIWDDLNRAIELVLLLLQGGEVAPDRSRLEPLRDPQLRQQAETLRTLLADFQKVSLERYRQGRDLAGVGSALDQLFDRTFLDVLQAAEELRRQLAERAAAERARNRFRLRLVIGAWSAIMLAAAAGLWRYERRRQTAVETLHQREAELLQAQKMEAVGRLAGGIAHDINNYLGAVRGYCEVTRIKHEDNPDLHRRMGLAIDAVGRASSLIRQLLAFSRKQPNRPEVVSLNRVVKDMESMMRRLLGEDIQLTTVCEDGLPNVEIDPSQLEQILVNLLVNSREAMPLGGEIVVRTARPEQAPPRRPGDPSPPPAGYVLLAVSDTGKGIPPEIKEKIFEPFFTTKPEGAGSGLGLATVFGIVRQNGGVVAVDSEVGRGTTFEIYLPASDRQAAGRADRQEMPLPEVGPLTLLLVEDNDDMRASTQAMLRALGHKVLVAEEADQALGILEREGDAIDLLISDVVMPGMSGADLLDEVRQRGLDLRCLFISGYTDNAVLSRALAHDGADFLQKPFSARSLAYKIANLARSPAAAAAAAARPSPPA
ncbi:MAG: response regulator [Acidobacteria bacterium]|nr:MAG: response regulator [Acidobacteriota bacterium]